MTNDSAPAASAPAGAPPLRLSGHLPTLDGLRGLAVLMVVMTHIQAGLVDPLTTVPDILLKKVQGTMWCGVDLFFVLSGFLITGILLDSKGGERYFRTFYARRALRIFPLYYGFLILLFFVLPALDPQVFSAQGLGSHWWYWTYLSNIHFALGNTMPLTTGYFWSLAVEEQFYLLWPLVVFMLPRRSLMRLSLAVIATLFVLRVALTFFGMTWIQVYVLMPLRMDALTMGALLAAVAREEEGLARLARWARPTLLVAGAASVLLTVYKPMLALLAGRSAFGLTRADLPYDMAVQTTRFTAWAFFFGALLVLVLLARPGSVLGRIFGGRVLRHFGRYSYAMYIFHVPLAVWAMDHHLGERFLPLVNGWQWPRALLVYALLVTSSMLVAMVSWHLYEKHFLKLKDRFAYARPRHRVVEEPGDTSIEPEREAFATP